MLTSAERSRNYRKRKLAANPTAWREAETKRVKKYYVKTKLLPKKEAETRRKRNRDAYKRWWDRQKQQQTAASGDENSDSDGGSDAGIPRVSRRDSVLNRQLAAEGNTSYNPIIT